MLFIFQLINNNNNYVVGREYFTILNFVCIGLTDTVTVVTQHWHLSSRAIREDTWVCLDFNAIALTQKLVHYAQSRHNLNINLLF
jgi:hypothetical protein